MQRPPAAPPPTRASARATPPSTGPLPLAAAFNHSKKRASASLLSTNAKSNQAVAGGPRAGPRRRRQRPPPRQDSLLYNLTLDIHNLRQQIYDLQVQRQVLHTRALYFSHAESHARIIQTVRHYFNGFAHGYHPPHVAHRAFVEAVCDDTLSMGTTGFGVEMLMEQWVRYSALFQTRQIILHSTKIITTTSTTSGGQEEEEEEAEEDGQVVVCCTVELRGAFTQAAINAVFPNARRDPYRFQRVLGKELVAPLEFHLYFNKRGKIVRHDATTDFCAAVQRALGRGDPGGVALFLEGAQIHEESMVGPVEEATEAIAEMAISSSGSTNREDRHQHQQQEHQHQHYQQYQHQQQQQHQQYQHHQHVDAVDNNAEASGDRDQYERSKVRQSLAFVLD